MSKSSTKFEDRYKKLNREQKRAVDTIEGPVLVVAGPGSGKTEILSLRIGRILQETQILASNILCLTFTESAASNMRKRLAGLIGTEAYRVAIHTFHSFCVEIIQKHPEYFYNGAFFSPADELTQIQILQNIFEKLPANHILRSEHPEQGFTYLRDTLRVIGNLKKAGLESSDFSAIIEHNKKSIDEINQILDKALSERLSKKEFAKINQAVEKLKILAKKYESDFPSDYFLNLPATVASSLENALKTAETNEDTKALSAWKTKWFKKDDDNGNLFKDTKYLDKMVALGKIYANYRAELHNQGYYDFNDMILDVLKTLEKNPAIRYEIQEQYQYVLVDEFQDTNDAQMRIIRSITDAPVYEGKPNIMAVGDDDQAVYKFQGAELSNILNFKKMFSDVTVVAMTKNYRSTQDILDVAEHIIKKGQERLEKILPEIEKNLIASNPDLANGEIKHREFPTQAHEYHFISREIQKKIKEGTKPEEIAIIARKHQQLEEIVPYLQGVGVPIRYEHEQNVFQEPHIAQLILLTKFISTVTDNRDEADELLPRILAFPFWNLTREDIWRVSIKARRGPEFKNWLEVMLEYPDKKVVDIAKFLIDLGARSQYEPLEVLIDELVGSHVPISGETEEDEEAAEISAAEISAEKKNKSFFSPFRNYYFSQEKFDHARAEYLTFLSSLRVFIGALREYKSGEILSAKDLVEFVTLHEKNNISLNDQGPFARLGEAVSLLTAHKAKGLEFETVFVLSCQDKIWAGRGFPNKLILPANLPIEPAGDNEDDQLRLFYVAITRAKRHLYLTSYQTEENGENASKLRFLIAEDGEEAVLKKASLRQIYLPQADVINEALPETHEVLTASWLNFHTPPFLGEEKKLLQTLLEDYQMPVTHLNNFLNITKGGPQYFLEQNLLRFPQAKTISSSYGSAIHSTLEQASLFLKTENKLPKIEEVLKWFEKHLRRERMAPLEFNLCLERGTEALTKFWSEKQREIKNTDYIEFNFKDQGVVIGEAHLSGKIDRIALSENNTVTVIDYKTGKAKKDWTGKDDYEKTKLYEYERQLFYYKLLVENSREFASKYKVKNGVLEFVEPKDDKLYSLELNITDEEKTERLQKLISIVYKHILDLNFPDISKYSANLNGIVDFENDLLDGKI